MGIFNFFKHAPFVEPIKDEERVKKEYKYWRLRIFYSMYIGYAFFYLTRKSFTFVMPAMIADLGFTKTDLGILGSILYVTYGISKFVSGIMSDRSNPRYFMSIGLILTGVFNILFGWSSSILFFALLWGLNGWFQGWGWPPCARLLTHWYSQSERGTWWGLWNTSHNVGGALIPLVVAAIAQMFGWRWAMHVPGMLCIVVGFFLINRLRDTPQSLGLPAIEKYRHKIGKEKELAEDDDTEENVSRTQMLMDFVIKNKYIWTLAFAYFFVYIVRTAVNDWGQLFLYEKKGFSEITAASCIFFFEAGGFLGSLAAGWFSDKIFSGRRGPINALFAFVVTLAVAGLWFTPYGSIALASAVMFAIGFFVFGPQMLIGVAAAELSHKKAAGTATGFIGWFAYFGAAAAGFPFGKITQDYGWEAFFLVLTVCALISTLFLIPLWNTRRRGLQMESGNKKPSVEKKNASSVADTGASDNIKKCVSSNSVSKSGAKTKSLNAKGTS